MAHDVPIAERLRIITMDGQLATCTWFDCLFTDLVIVDGPRFRNVAYTFGRNNLRVRQSRIISSRCRTTCLKNAGASVVQLLELCIRGIVICVD